MSAPEKHLPAVLTPDGRERLEARARELRDDVLPRLDERLRLEPDPGEEAARARLAEELADIERVLRSATLTDSLRGDPRVIEIGDEVTVRFPDGTVEELWIVHPVEAPLDAHRISATSPLARALLGRHVGDEVVVDAPGGKLPCVVLAARLHVGGGRYVERHATV